MPSSLTRPDAADQPSHDHADAAAPFVEAGASSAEAASGWHSRSADDVLAEIRSTRDGLTEADAADRLRAFGSNVLVERHTAGPWRLLWEQLTAVMVVILIAAAGLSLALGKVLEAATIAVVVVLFVGLGFVQEFRAERAIAALRRLAAPTVRVVRDGRTAEVDASSVVPGDVVLLEAGSVVPADLRLFESASLRVQEAALTGESEPVDKHIDPLEGADLALGDRRNMAYAGTQVSYGRGRGVAVATGMGTELGRIATLLQDVHASATPLQARLDRVGKQLAAAGVGVAALVVLMGALGGEAPSELALTAISVAVAVVPEGLPAVVTFTLAIGAQRMLRRQALIRKLPSVETLGSVTVICSDKTGTLTQNQMTVTVVETANARWRVEEPLSGEVPTEIRFALAAAALCNDADAHVDDDGHLHALGDPTETALVNAASRVGIHVPALRRAVPRVAERPFDSERKRMATIHTALDAVIGPITTDAPFALVKGAVDSLLPRAVAMFDGAQAVPLTEHQRQDLNAANDRLARAGMRVLGVAYRTLPAGDASDIAEDDLIWIGLIAMIDPPRPEVRDAIATCRRAGIRAVMITGDHPLTAHAIAHDIGLTAHAMADDVGSPQGRVCTGAELEHLDDDELADVTQNVNVFARVSPEHKLRIVESLQQHGHIVAMTGDGVNDAPALRKADIGVAMGITGTDVSKAASDMVLRDDNFVTIVAAVEEGRVIYDNLRRFVKFAVAGNLGKIIVMLGWPLPILLSGAEPAAAVALLPLQLLWLNLMTDGLLGLSLGVEPAERSVMRRPPTPPGQSIWADGLGIQAAWTGALIGALSLGVGFLYDALGHDHWQTMIFATVAFAQIFQAIGSRSNTESLRTIGVRTNPLLAGVVTVVVLLQLAALYTPLRHFLDLQRLNAADLAVCIAAGSTVLAALETHKAVRRLRPRHTPSFDFARRDPYVRGRRRPKSSRS